MAELFKEVGNKLFRQKKYEQSVTKYSEAIKLDPDNAQYYANRAAAFMLLQQYNKAETDARRSIELAPKYLKGHFRLACVYQSQHKFQEALNVYSSILNSKYINTKQNQIDVIKKKMSFCENELKRKDIFDKILTTKAKRKLFPRFKLKKDLKKSIPPSQPIETAFNTAIKLEHELKRFDVSSQFYRYLCNKNHVESICNYALWYLYGDRLGVNKNLKKAYEMFEYATFLDRNLGFALYNLSQFYFKGNVVAQNYKIAFKLCKKAIQDKQMKIDLKHHQSYALISQMYALGRGTNVNMKLSGKYMNISNEILHGKDYCLQNQNEMKFQNLLKQMQMFGSQRELDKRWDTMCAYLQKYEKQKLDELELKYGKRAKKYICTVGEYVKIMKMCGFDIHGYNEKIMKNMKCMNGMVIDFQNLGISYTVNHEFNWNKSKIKATRVCGGCSKAIEGKVFLCRNCEQSYCSKSCQKKDWVSHKQHCILISTPKTFD
eukprot:395494_1